MYFSSLGHTGELVMVNSAQFAHIAHLTFYCRGHLDCLKERITLLGSFSPLTN